MSEDLKNQAEVQDEVEDEVKDEVENEVEVAGDEDAGGGVLGDMVFDGVEEGN